MEFDHAPLESHLQLTDACDCPVHSQVGSLLAELDEAQSEVRRLRTAAAAGRASQLSDRWGLTAPHRWSGLVRMRRSLWWALSDSE